MPYKQEQPVLPIVPFVVAQIHEFQTETYNSILFAKDQFKLKTIQLMTKKLPEGPIKDATFQRFFREKELGIPTRATMAGTITTIDSINRETMTAVSTPTEPSLTNSIETSTISATVQPTSTGFTMPFEDTTTTVATETTLNTSLSTRIPIQKLTTMTPSSNPTDPSLMENIETVISSATVQPTSTGFTISFEPPPSSLSASPPSTTELGTTQSSSLSASNPAAESRIIYTRLSVNDVDTEPQAMASITRVTSSPKRIQQTTTRPVTATVGASTQSPFVETIVSGMTTKLPVTTDSATALFSINTVSPMSGSTTSPATIITKEVGIPIRATMAAANTTTNSITAATMVAVGTPTEPSLTNSIETSTISATVQPTSTGFTMSFKENTTTVATKTTLSTTLFTSISAAESTTTETMTGGGNPTDPSLTNNIDAAITSATVQPTSTEFTMALELSPSSPSPPPPPELVAIQCSTLSASIPEEEPRIIYTTPSVKVGDKEPQTMESITIITSSPQQIQQMTMNPVMATVRASTQSPSVETTVSGMTTNLPLTTDATTASFGINTVSPMTGNTSTPATIITMARREQIYQTEHLPTYILDPPHDSWELNVLLDTLAQNINDVELERLKYFEYGRGSIGKRTFEEIRTARRFFQILQEMEFVSVDNLIHLQALLWHLGRIDLLKECVEYAKTASNTLYFHQPSPEPVNGYKYAEFHVEGKDLSTYRRKDLEQLRCNISRRLCVPPEYIVISGVMPRKSLAIIIMIPEYHAEILLELLKENSMTELTELGIDSVFVHGQTFFLIDKSKVVISEDRDETLELFKKLEWAQSLLDLQNANILRLRDKLEEADNNKIALERNEEGENKHRNSTSTEPNIDKLMSDISELLRSHETEEHVQRKYIETNSALAYFIFAKKKVKALGQDQDIIMQLLEANTYVVSSRMNNERKHVIQTLKNLQEKLQQLSAPHTSESLSNRSSSTSKNITKCSEAELKPRSELVFWFGTIALYFYWFCSIMLATHTGLMYTNESTRNRARSQPSLQGNLI